MQFVWATLSWCTCNDSAGKITSFQLSPSPDSRMSKQRLVITFEALRMTDVDKVGGKNASLGEMISQLARAGIRVPGGFATTAEAYREFLAQNGLATRIDDLLKTLDPDDTDQLAACGSQIRNWIVETPFPPALEKELEGH